MGHNLRAHVEDLEKKMLDYASNLEFEDAARLRDEISRLESAELGCRANPPRRFGSASAR